MSINKVLALRSVYATRNAYKPLTVDTKAKLISSLKSVNYNLQHAVNPPGDVHGHIFRDYYPLLEKFVKNAADLNKVQDSNYFLAEYLKTNPTPRKIEENKEIYHLAEDMLVTNCIFTTAICNSLPVMDVHDALHEFVIMKGDEGYPVNLIAKALGLNSNEFEYLRHLPNKNYKFK